ncbi:SWI/SNF-related matrix-associated actin-dependent regulator of chromatin subfamily A-like protein 1 isoform X2 [Hydractinia symbiolongicarpus]|uniref:SWI/SNF-related matrix-associated actin-dependent regulator of chromatin subfamily A-like protein 1 isoform X2 n=1 Tax=Hydractinia symbiolongicarpus TaxID=13093 RepID=UPI00254DEB8C|nr:SWI/SNF-related matrix-associated actin-dependent regulator of chromatin subfamily A-like protein 1 isoform X2 [Hydractinia symbiolongicarpus]
MTSYKKHDGECPVTENESVRCSISQESNDSMMSYPFEGQQRRPNAIQPSPNHGQVDRATENRKRAIERLNKKKNGQNVQNVEVHKSISESNVAHGSAAVFPSTPPPNSSQNQSRTTSYSPRFRKQSTEVNSSQNSFWHSPISLETSVAKPATSFSPRMRRKSAESKSFSESNVGHENADTFPSTPPPKSPQNQSRAISYSPKFRKKSTEVDSSQSSFWHSPISSETSISKPITSFSPRMRKKMTSNIDKSIEDSTSPLSPNVKRSLFVSSGSNVVAKSNSNVSTVSKPEQGTSLTIIQKQRMEENRLKALNSLKEKGFSTTSVQKTQFLQNEKQKAEDNKIVKTSTQFVNNSPSLQTTSARVSVNEQQRAESNKQKAIKKLQQRKSLQSSPQTEQGSQYPAGYHSPPKQEIKIKLSVKNVTWFQVEHEMKFKDAIKQCVSKLDRKQYDPATKFWLLHIQDYNAAVDLFKHNLNVSIDHIPSSVVLILQKNHRESKVCIRTDIGAIEPDILETLYPFQRKGVLFSVEKNGRVLIADDMGLGKTVQAIALASYYKNEWPVLVLCPSSVKMSWQQHFLSFIPSLTEDGVNIVFTGKDNPTIGDVNIISYDMASKLADVIASKRFKVIIADESHLLKNRNAIRTKNIVPIIQKSKRAILLSGTPALSRPKELYTQIAALYKFLFPNYIKFSQRYCDAKQGRFGWDDSGCSNYEELNSVLKCTMMIRRVKEDVLQDLPPKSRSINGDQESAVRTYYQATAAVKIKGVCEFLSDKLEFQQKLIVFAHHQIMLDAIEQMLKKKNITSVRIDGTTHSRTRQRMIDFFNNDQSCLVAILSITAAGQGITLTGSSIIIFAELYWNPGHLIQAEDRAHRIGQTNCVTAIYLIAKETADDYIWEKVKSKLAVLTCLGIGKKKGLDGVASSFTNPKQKRILDYFTELLDKENDFHGFFDENSSTVSQPPEKRVKLT